MLLLIRPITAALGMDEVHVWAVTTEDPPLPFQRLRMLLAKEECERADRFHFRADRHRSILGRGSLRAILAHYLDAAPDALAFSYGAYGKPLLAPGWTADIEFNLSHSGQWVLIGVTRGRAIGVDVEQVRPVSDCERIAERFFAPGELGVIRSLPEGERLEAFFTCWTRKEAYIKALGAGLTATLDDFEVSVRRGDPPALLTFSRSAEPAARWTLWAGAPESGYLAAAAIEGAGMRIVPRFWTASSGITPWLA